MAIDLTNTVIESLIEHLPRYCNEGLTTDDGAYLKGVMRHPLQDDPTRRSYYLTVKPGVGEHDKLTFRKPVSSLSEAERTLLGPRPTHEVGGDFLMVNWFEIEGWTPRRQDAQKNFELVGRALRQLERAIQRMQRDEFFARLATDDGNETTAGLLQCFNSYDRGFKVLGGESERYGQVWLRFVLYSAVANEYWG